MINHINEVCNQAIFTANKIAVLNIIQEALQKDRSPEETKFKVVLSSIEYTATTISKGSGASLAQLFITFQIAATVTYCLVSGLEFPPEIFVDKALSQLNMKNNKTYCKCAFSKYNYLY